MSLYFEDKLYHKYNDLIDIAFNTYGYSNRNNCAHIYTRLYEEMVSEYKSYNLTLSRKLLLKLCKCNNMLLYKDHSLNLTANEASYFIQTDSGAITCKHLSEDVLIELAKSNPNYNFRYFSTKSSAREFQRFVGYPTMTAQVVDCLCQSKNLKFDIIPALYDATETFFENFDISNLKERLLDIADNIEEGFRGSWELRQLYEFSKIIKYDELSVYLKLKYGDIKDMY